MSAAVLLYFDLPSFSGEMSAAIFGAHSLEGPNDGMTPGGSEIVHLRLRLPLFIGPELMKPTVIEGTAFAIGGGWDQPIDQPEENADDDQTCKSRINGMVGLPVP